VDFDDNPTICDAKKGPHLSSPQPLSDTYAQTIVVAEALYMVAPALPPRLSKPMQKLEIQTQRYKHDLQAAGLLSREGCDSVITQIDSSELSDNRMVRAYDYAFIPSQ
jgi:hypothetical protein